MHGAGRIRSIYFRQRSVRSVHVRRRGCRRIETAKQVRMVVDEIHGIVRLRRHFAPSGIKMYILHGPSVWKCMNKNVKRQREPRQNAIPSLTNQAYAGTLRVLFFTERLALMTSWKGSPATVTRSSAGCASLGTTAKLLAAPRGVWPALRS
eukprot:13929640-Heterocapsa_arctica.AAC.1